MGGTEPNRRSGSIDRRSKEETAYAAAMLRPFAQAGYRLFPLVRGKKHPRDVGWQQKRYTSSELVDWLRTGGNIGICLGTTHLVLDADPRHFEPGDDPIRRLAAAVGLHLAAVPTVFSGRGDGGQHLYLRKPAAVQVRKSLPGFAGIDVKTQGGLVVAPGSRHIETGGVYEVDPIVAPIDQAPQAPQALLDMLRRPAPTTRAFGGGELTVDQLATLLRVLDPRDYREYSRWIAFSAAVHDATAGAGLDVWLEWAARDPEYDSEEHAHRNVRTWESFTAGRPGGTNYLFVLQQVARAGHPELALAIEPNYVFDDRPVFDHSDRDDAPVLTSKDYTPDDAPILSADELMPVDAPVYSNDDEELQ